MKRKIIIFTSLITAFIFILFFSFKVEAADPTFTCTSRPSQKEIALETAVTGGVISDYNIGIIKSSEADNKNYPKTIWDSFQYSSEGKSENRYYFEYLEKSTDYKAIAQNKTSKTFYSVGGCDFKTPGIINGVCGSANGGAFKSKPTENLCSAGSATAVSEVSKEWSWRCNSTNGGSNVSCSATVGTKVSAASSGSLLVPECPDEGCGFKEFMELINKVINFLLFVIATPLAALIFVYAGIMLITAGGDPGKFTTAKTILKNLVFGYVIALAAWLIVNTILTSLGFHGAWFLTRY
jgi:hypothetical protein